ncbi:MAG: S-layer homology domain-containing protein, partial [Clostridiales bacterium]|nr:S-layer homology domain-containing protein [Clostridiales bacterium]
ASVGKYLLFDTDVSVTGKTNVKGYVFDNLTALEAILIQSYPTKFAGSELPFNLAAIKPLKAGYDLEGWYKEAGLINKITTITEPGNITLYAKWTATTGPVSTFPFTDVYTTHWFYGHIKYVYDLGLMNGTGATIFSPNAQVTRAMVVTVLHRMEGEPQITTPAGFSDVKAGMWYTNGVAWAEANKIVEGYPGNVFRPEQNVSRQELATILLRYAKFIGKAQPSAGPNPDDPPDDETPDTLPVTTPTSNDLTFADAAKVGDWAKEGVAFCAKNGIIEGRPGNIFDPAASATRAEFATMLHRFIEKF